MAPESPVCKRCSKTDFQQLFAMADELFTKAFPYIPPPGNSSNKDLKWVVREEIDDPTVLSSVTRR
ncbi:hypothetical protein F4814DRAFT_399706 [Daldinia grandis]|nr:hypothetical protein F4814DRAFT_399706 [Daldinia grandis]